MPAQGNPQGADAPNVPTAAQLAQLATLQATLATAQSNLDAIKNRTGTLRAAQKAYLNAQYAVTQYEAYIYGGMKPGIYDEGGPSVT